MMVTQALTLLAAATAGAGQHSEQVELGVTATVVRPAEIATLTPLPGGAVALVRNSASIEVHADGGTVRRLDDETVAVSGDGATSVTITLTF